MAGGTNNSINSFNPWYPYLSSGDIEKKQNNQLYKSQVCFC